jgi:hypothetical protein
MRALSSTLALTLTLALTACSSAPTQLDLVRDYINEVEPIATELNNDAQTFVNAMSQGGAPDALALTDIRTSLQTSINGLQTIVPTDPEIKAAHAHLIKGEQELAGVIDRVSDALQNPADVPEDFANQIQTQVDSATAEVTQWQNGIAGLLPEEERAAFLEAAAEAQAQAGTQETE